MRPNLPKVQNGVELRWEMTRSHRQHKPSRPVPEKAIRYPWKRSVVTGHDASAVTTTSMPSTSARNQRATAALHNTPKLSHWCLVISSQLSRHGFPFGRIMNSQPTGQCHHTPLKQKINITFCNIRSPPGDQSHQLRYPSHFPPEIQNMHT